MGDDNERAARAEQGALDHEFLGGALLAPRLADDRDVKSAADTPEQIGRASDAGIERAGLGRYPRCSGSALKAGDRLPGGARVLLPLGFDQVGRNIAEEAAWDHRLVDEAD